MTCPKQSPVYPNTTTRIEVPWIAQVRRADPDFDRAHRFDTAYEFGGRRFIEDAMNHGAYAPVAGLDAGCDAGAPAASLSLLTLGPQDGAAFAAIDAPVMLPGDAGADAGYDAQVFFVGPSLRDQVDALLHAQFSADNGFCDPFLDDGTITTGTGAGGRNPGTVPSHLGDADLTDAGIDAATLLTVGAVFYGGGMGDAGSDASRADAGDGGLPFNLAVD